MKKRCNNAARMLTKLTAICLVIMKCYAHQIALEAPFVTSSVPILIFSQEIVNLYLAKEPSLTLEICNMENKCHDVTFIEYLSGPKLMKFDSADLMEAESKLLLSVRAEYDGITLTTDKIVADYRVTSEASPTP